MMGSSEKLKHVRGSVQIITGLASMTSGWIKGCADHHSAESRPALTAIAAFSLQ